MNLLIVLVLTINAALLTPSIAIAADPDDDDIDLCMSLFFPLKDAPEVWRRTFDSDAQEVATASCRAQEDGKVEDMVYYLILNRQRTEGLMARVHLLPKCPDGVAIVDGAKFEMKDNRADVIWLSQGGQMSQAWYGWLADWLIRTRLKLEPSCDAAITKIPTELCPADFNAEFRDWYEEDIQRAYRENERRETESQPK